jgi:hypothetical protein
LFAVLITGTILAVRAWPLTPLHFIKIATSLVAVGSALICTLWVFQIACMSADAPPNMISCRIDRKSAR